MNKAMQAMNGQIVKRYRMFERRFSDAVAPAWPADARVFDPTRVRSSGASAVAGASFLAGAGIIALLRSRRARKNAWKLLRGGRRGRNGRIEVLGTRSFLVDVHFVDRR